MTEFSLSHSVALLANLSQQKLIQMMTGLHSSRENLSVPISLLRCIHPDHSHIPCSGNGLKKGIYKWTRIVTLGVCYKAVGKLPTPHLTKQHCIWLSFFTTGASLHDPKGLRKKGKVR